MKYLKYFEAKRLLCVEDGYSCQKGEKYSVEDLSTFWYVSKKNISLLTDNGIDFYKKGDPDKVIRFTYDKTLSDYKKRRTEEKFDL